MNRQQRINAIYDFARKDYKGVRDYANGENVNPSNTLAHVASTASAIERLNPGSKLNLQNTGNLYDRYNKELNRGGRGSSRKMRSYRNKSSKSNKRNKRTRRGKRRLH